MKGSSLMFALTHNIYQFRIINFTSGNCLPFVSFLFSFARSERDEGNEMEKCNLMDCNELMREVDVECGLFLELAKLGVFIAYLWYFYGQLGQLKS